MTPFVPHCIRINRQPFYFPAKLQDEVVTCVAVDRDGTVHAYTSEPRPNITNYAWQTETGERRRLGQFNTAHRPKAWQFACWHVTV